MLVNTLVSVIFVGVNVIHVFEKVILLGLVLVDFLCVINVYLKVILRDSHMK